MSLFRKKGDKVEFLLVILVVFVIFQVPISLGMGLIFDNMNLGFKNGLVPFYNKVLLVKFCRLPKYHFILLFIPMVSLYTDFMIFSNIGKRYNKDFLYVLKLTFLPFIYSIFLGLEFRKSSFENVDDYFEDQKSLYEKGKGEEKNIVVDDYVWMPKKENVRTGTYKVVRDGLHLNVSCNSDVIISNKKNDANLNGVKVCAKCGSKITSDTGVCVVCGTKY